MKNLKKALAVFCIFCCTLVTSPLTSLYAHRKVINENHYYFYDKDREGRFRNRRVPVYTEEEVINRYHYYDRYSSKDGIITLLLAVFGGFAGLHRFYVGKDISGIIWLLTFGGFGIGWICDIVNIWNGEFLDAEGKVVQVV